jgi:probable HAF family extracellular repeat protein
MRRAVIVVSLFVGVVVLLVGASGAGSTRSVKAGWAIADLGVWSAEAINERGQTIGNGCAAECSGWAVLWQDGKMTALFAHPAGDSDDGSDAAALNDRGQVVGWVYTLSYSGSYSGIREEHAFLWRDGRTTYLTNLPGGRQSAAYGINELGQVVGWGETKTADLHAVLWQDGRIRDLGTLGGKWSTALAINERGQVVGWSETKTGERHAFLWEDGRMRDLGTLNGQRWRGSEARAINDRGQIVGISYSGTSESGTVHAFFWQNGKMRDLGRVPEDKSGVGSTIAINNGGQVIGNRLISRRSYIPRTRAFLWDSGRITYLTMPRGAISSQVRAVNERGQIVGGYSANEYTDHACLWEKGRMIDLGFLGQDDHRGTGAVALSINERGQIVGQSWHMMDFIHSALWTQRR